MPTLSVLGLFSLRPLPPVALRRKERALLAYLAVTARPQPRHHLLHLFTTTAAHPTAQLRLLLSRIRQVSPDVLLTQGDEVQYNPALRVDYHIFTQALSGELTEQTTERIAAALELYQGALLSGLELDDAPEFMLWLLHERAYLQTLYEQGLTELINRAQRLGQWAEAIRWAQRLVTANPLLETAHQQLITLYGQTGQYDAAADQYEQYRTILQRELGVAPGVELQALFHTLWRGREQETSTTPPTIFVGRVNELTDLGRAWQRAQKGQGTWVWIEAEAGCGKSQLVHHFARQLALPYLMGDCFESAQHLPYSPWIDLLEQHLNRHSPTITQQLSPYSRNHLARLLPAWANHLGHPGGSFNDAPYDQTGLFQTVIECLFQCGPRQPLVLFLDNLQWADEYTLQLFHFLARRISYLPCLLIGAMRPLAENRNPALLTLWQDGQRLNPTVVRLSPLAAAAVETWLHQQHPDLPPEQLRKMAQRLHQATGGNPLFLTELLQALPDTPHLPDPLPVPASVRELVQRRLHTLPQTSQDVLKSLAVWDTPAPLALVQQISGTPETETILALDAGVGLGLLRYDDSERFLFFHDLVREAVAETLTPLRRRLIHRQIAAACHLMPPDERQEQAGTIWRHALAGGDDGLVFSWGLKAAQAAASFYAFGEAIRILETTCEVFTRLPFTPEGETQYLQMLLSLLWLLAQVGRPLPEQETLLRQAQTLLAKQAQPELQAIYHLHEASWLADLGRYQEAIAAAYNAYEHFMDLPDAAGAARSLHLAGGCQITISRNRQGRQILAQSLQLYQSAGDHTGALLCLNGLAWADLNLGQIRSAIHTLQQALALTQTAGDKLGQARIYTTLAAAWSYFCQFDKVLALSQQARDLYLSMGLPPYRPLLHLGMAQWHQDQAEAAQQLFQQLFTEATRQNDTWLAGWAAQLLGRMALQQGQLTQAEQRLEQATQLRRQMGELANQVSDLAWLGRLRLAQGRLDEALAHTGEAVRRQEALRDEAYVFEAADICLAHREVLQAMGDEAAAAHYHHLAQQWHTFLADQLDTVEAQAEFNRMSRYAL